MESTVTRKTKTKFRIPPPGLRPGWEWGQASGPCEGLGPPPTQASVTDAMVKPGKDPGACTQEEARAKEVEGPSLHLPWLDCLGLYVWLLQHGGSMVSICPLLSLGAVPFPFAHIPRAMA